VHAPDLADETDLPLLIGKSRKHGRSTAYVCERYRCDLPVTTAEALAAQLEAKGAATK
jgi:uncharacterized protein YyaL (SSP411 family)